MATMIDDTTALPLMEELLDCAVAELELRDLPVAHPELAFGQEAVFDGFCEGRDDDESCPGKLWARLVSGYPTDVELDSFPEPATRPLRYPNESLAYTIELGIARKLIVPDRAEALTVDQRRTTAALQLADMTALRIAICKCFSERLFVLGQYATLTLGDITSGSWTVTVQHSKLA
jgi:hypothetical protein